MGFLVGDVIGVVYGGESLVYCFHGWGYFWLEYAVSARHIRLLVPIENRFPDTKTPLIMRQPSLLVPIQAKVPEPSLPLF